MTRPLLVQPVTPRPLHLHQERTHALLRRSIVDGKRRPLVMLPTGGGKTRLAAEIVRGALGKGKPVAFTVPAVSLIDQTLDAFEGEGISAIGVMQGIHPRTDREQPVQVCSVQTVARRKRPDVDIVIVDEAHQMHREIFRWMKDCPDVLFIGLSATPWARGLGKYYDDLIIAATTAELIEARFLSDFVAFAPSEPDLSDVRTVAGDFHEGELADAMDQPKITGDIVDTWLKRGEDRPTLVFCVNRKHAQHVTERFIEAEIATEYLDGATPREDREKTFVRFRAGKTRVICNVGVLTTGIDLPMASCLIDAKPTRSEMLFVQTIGRGLRTAPGKDRLIILDHAGNHLRLGKVTDVHHDKLDDGQQRQSASEKSKPAEALLRLCGHCRAVLPAHAKACTECGEPVRAVSTVQAVDGELVELGSRKSGARTWPTWQKQLFYGELLGHAEARGYSSGWASHKFKERFAHWPNGYPRVAISPGVDTANWIKSRQIAFAKVRRAAHG
jgi:DNA repair protein RadD